MYVRLASVEDLEPIAELDRAVRDDPSRAAALRQAVVSKSCWVAERDGSMLGYVTMNESFYGRPFVSFLFVRREARRSGVGSALLCEIEMRYGSSRIFTSTNQSNAPMQRLLVSLGYLPSGVILNLDPGDPELVYVRHPRGSD